MDHSERIPGLLGNLAYVHIFPGEDFVNGINSYFLRVPLGIYECTEGGWYRSSKNSILLNRAELWDDRVVLGSENWGRRAERYGTIPFDKKSPEYTINAFLPDNEGVLISAPDINDGDVRKSWIFLKEGSN